MSHLNLLCISLTPIDDSKSARVHACVLWWDYICTDLMSNPETVSSKYRLDIFNWKTTRKWACMLDAFPIHRPLAQKHLQRTTITAYRENYADNNSTQSVLTAPWGTEYVNTPRDVRLCRFCLIGQATSLWWRCVEVGLSESHIMRSMSHFRSIDKFQHDTSGKRARGHELPWGFSQTEHRLCGDPLHVEPVTSHLGLSMFYNLRERMLAKSV